jgi:hypothetical protein
MCGMFREYAMDWNNVCAKRQTTQEEKMTLKAREIQEENPKNSMPSSPSQCKFLKPNKRWPHRQ